MKNVKFIKILLISIAYFITYLCATILHSPFWGGILSPIGGLFSFAIIIYTYLKIYKTYEFKSSLILYSLVCLSWALADIFWFVYDFILGINPENSVLIIYLYMMTNVFICITGLIYTGKKFKKWNGIQLLVDVIAISASSALLLWIIFFNRDMLLIKIISKDGLASIISMSADFVIFIGYSVWYLSIREGKISISKKIITLGVLLFIFTDLNYYYLYFYELYHPYTLNDVSYIASLLIIALGLYLESYPEDSKNINSECTNVGFKHKGLMLLLCPILTFIFKGYNINDLLAFIIIIFSYEFISFYIQTSIKNEQLLKKEKEINYILEEQIAEHTKELIHKNEELIHKNEELIEKNKELNYLSNQDTVTKLYNRRYFITTLEERLVHITQPETVALLFIDLDRFKTINDAYGHDVGDKVLIEISQRLKSWNGHDVTLARLGGDEFIFAFYGQYEYGNIEEIAQQIITKCNDAIEIEQYTFHITLSIGIAIYPIDSKDISTLMKNADIAMYHAKSKGYNKFVCFDSLLDKRISRKNEIEILLRKANFDNEFQLYYQPQFSIPDKKLTGIEALLRWNNPINGFISPNEFIPIAEEMDYIIPIGRWVMKEAVRQIAKWNNIYPNNIKMGINISPKQLDNTSFIKELKSIMKNNLVDSNWIDIEITESIAIEGEYRITEIANLFRGVDVSISIDDFGTGYSSLSYLKFFTFDRIKIAKPLIDAISSDVFDLQIVKAIIMLAKSIGIKTIAEGVEFKDQLDILIKLGCEEVQGFLLGKPMPSEEFEETFLSK